MNGNTYTVRRPGNTAWAERLSLKEALRECEIANRICAPGHEIIRDTADDDDAAAANGSES